MSHDTVIGRLTACLSALADDWADCKTSHAGDETYAECARQLRETLRMCGLDLGRYGHAASCSLPPAAGPRQLAGDRAPATATSPAITTPRPPGAYCTYDPADVLAGLRECSAGILPEISRLDQDDRALVCQIVTRLTKLAGADLTECAGPDAICGCGEPITQYDGVWLHIYNPELRGTDDHDASPG